ncbi:MAG: hypothetical protein VX044_08960, partial [Planctomycetota bacterium]|nr:hypothetical protein [Planctomycetota bacterium]
VNALFLDPTQDQIVDHVNGLADIEARVIRTIGDPVVRFREDPVRILRAAKFAGRLSFDVEAKTLAAMAETSEDLVRAAPPRVLEEILRLLRSGHASDSFRLLDEVRAIEHLVPLLGAFLADADDERVDAFWALLRALDTHIQDQPAGAEPPPNGVLLAVLVYEAVAAEHARTPKRSASSVAEDLLGSLATDLRLPRRDSGCLKRACGVQHRFAQAEDQRRFRAENFVHGPYFEESLLLFTLRTAAEEGDPEAAATWRALAEAEGVSASVSAEDALEGSDEPPRKKRRRRRRRQRDDDDDRGDDRGAEATSGEAASEDEPPARARRSRRRAPAEQGAAGEDLSDVTFPSGADDDGSHASDQSETPDDGDEALVDEAEEVTLSNITLDDVTFDDDEQDDEAPRKRRRRRGRRGRGRSKDGGDDEADESSAGDATDGKGERPRRGRSKERQKDGAKDGRSRRDGKRGEQRKKRAKKSRGGVRSDVGVVPRHRDRRGKVEVIEPVAQDLSAFDVELDPKRVPTFGSIVEGKPRPKRRGPRLTNKSTDDYRPPPPPGSDAPPSSPPPAPRSDDDTFGDW